MRASFFDLYDTIILVDDDPLSNLLNRIKISQLTETKNILTFDNAKEALHSLNEICNDRNYRKVLIFLDIHMPKITGLHFLDFIPSFEKIDNHDIDVVVISGQANPDLEYEELHNPFVIGINEKPVEMKRVLDQIQDSKLKLLQF